MQEAVPSGADDKSAESPRSVTRGLNLQVGHLGLDSLYLVVEYPLADVYLVWADYVKRTPGANLHDGVLVDDMVLRTGAHGYKLSVWDGDARLYLTDQVDAVLAGTDRDGHGMGMMLQLGPKWLAKYGNMSWPEKLLENVHAQLSAFGARQVEQYRIRINRLDICLDVIGLAVADLLVDDWRAQWVGYSRISDVHYSRQTGDLETIAVGTSEGKVRFKVYDKRAESVKKGSSTFWRSVWGLAEDDASPVARFEWSVKVYEACFSGLRYLDELCYQRLVEVLNYVSLRWGRLCTPNESDTNKSRWPNAPLWDTLRGFIAEWTINNPACAERKYDFTPDLNPAYLNSLAGWLAGYKARMGVQQGEGGPLKTFHVFSSLREQGYGLGKIESKARRKYKLYARLSGKGGRA